MHKSAYLPVFFATQYVLSTPRMTKHYRRETPMV